MIHFSVNLFDPVDVILIRNVGVRDSTLELVDSKSGTVYEWNDLIDSESVIVLFSAIHEILLYVSLVYALHLDAMAIKPIKLYRIVNNSRC